MSELTDPDKKVLSDIENFGCHIVHVSGDETGPGFSYSIGLFKTFNHPEIIFIGLKQDLAQVLINNICYDIRNGKSFIGGHAYPDILDDFQCYMVNVKTEFYDEHFGYAKWYYKSDEFPVLQCVYPTTSGVFPWDPNAPEGFAEHQPVLGDSAKS